MSDEIRVGWKVLVRINYGYTSHWYEGNVTKVTPAMFDVELNQNGANYRFRKNAPGSYDDRFEGVGTKHLCYGHGNTFASIEHRKYKEESNTRNGMRWAVNWLENLENGGITINDKTAKLVDDLRRAIREYEGDE